MAEKSRSITLWIVTEYFHDLVKVCDNVCHSVYRSPPQWKRKKKIIFDKLEEGMTKKEMQAEMEKLKICCYVAKFCKKSPSFSIEQK